MLRMKKITDIHKNIAPVKEESPAQSEGHCIYNESNDLDSCLRGDDNSSCTGFFHLALLTSSYSFSRALCLYDKTKCPNIFFKLKYSLNKIK